MFEMRPASLERHTNYLQGCKKALVRIQLWRQILNIIIMETNFNFKSQICTTKEQSEKLLALGLKPETADCKHTRCWSPENGIEYDVPAWSLHRLLSLLPTEIPCEVENGLGMFLDDENAVSYFGVLGYYTHDNLYNAVILCIEDVIKEGYFNKEYLV